MLITINKQINSGNKYNQKIYIYIYIYDIYVYILYTYPNAEFGYVFNFHLPTICAELQLQVMKRLTLNLSMVIRHSSWSVYSYMSNITCQIYSLIYLTDHSLY